MKKYFLLLTVVLLLGTFAPAAHADCPSGQIPTYDPTTGIPNGGCEVIPGSSSSSATPSSSSGAATPATLPPYTAPTSPQTSLNCTGSNTNNCIPSGSAAAPPSSVPNAAPTTCPGGGTFNASTGVCNLGYTQLEPIPGLTTQTGSGPGSLVDPNNLHTVIDAIFKILITAGALIAVLSLTIGGVQYMVSGSAGGKNAGIKRAQAALWAILLIASSWLILNTINPGLLSFSLNPCPQGGTTCTVATSASNVTTPTSTTVPSAAGTSLQNITVNQGNCTDVRDAVAGSLTNYSAIMLNIRTGGNILFTNTTLAQSDQSRNDFINACGAAGF